MIVSETSLLLFHMPLHNNNKKNSTTMYQNITANLQKTMIS